MSKWLKALTVRVRHKCHIFNAKKLIYILFTYEVKLVNKDSFCHFVRSILTSVVDFSRPEFENEPVRTGSTVELAVLSTRDVEEKNR